MTEYLYKYRSMQSIDVDRIITHNALFFPSPSRFNDPFDCKTGFSLKHSTEKRLAKFHKLIVNILLKDAPPQEKDKFIKEAVERHKNNDIEFEEHILIAIRKGLEDSNDMTLGVQCFSKIPDHILMWSHYSDGHRGFVLQFDKYILDKLFKYSEKVVYSDNYPSLNQFVSKNSRTLFELFLFKKSTHWKYEQEWRIVQPVIKNDGTKLGRVFILPPMALTGIILGSEMSDKDKERVIMWSKNSPSKIKLYDARKDYDEFKINIEPFKK